MKKKKTRTGIWALLGKIGLKLTPLLSKLTALKVGLAALSFGSYALLFSWQFALMLIFMLFVHESGHVWAMRRYGVPTKGFYFIPFVGGAAVAESEFPSRKAEVVIAAMGPVWGFALALVTGLAYLITRDPLFAAASAWMALINAFQLLPVDPLDGGRIMKSIAFSIHTEVGLIFLAMGIAASIVLTIFAHIWIFALLLFFGAIDLLLEYNRRIHLPRMNAWSTLLSVATYAGLAAALIGLMVIMSHEPGAAAAMQFLQDG